MVRLRIECQSAQPLGLSRCAPLVRYYGISRELRHRESGCAPGHTGQRKNSYHGGEEHLRSGASDTLAKAECVIAWIVSAPCEARALTAAVRPCTVVFADA